MPYSTNQKIAIFAALLTAAVAVWATLYTNSPDIVHSVIEHPDSIQDTYYPADFYFEISNHGVKTGSYEVTLTSNNNSMDFSSESKGDFKRELDYSFALPPNDMDPCFLYVKENESHVKENITITLSIVDRCGIIHDIDQYTYYYDFDSESHRYVFRDVEFNFKRGPSLI
ncbi:hypothetical protein [uncultured Methanolobus sp.]|uniref:hypothetical protein n=1 Tax=uncultured Methanolobus sp. TaxID=218300 RepID=UPI0029C847A4|nr:hypothetical protein [uncultured Methanolobus sp.]